MLQVSHVSKSYGAQTILDDVSFVLNPGARAGLVGPNGSGKTTLLRLIAGAESPDSGYITLKPDTVMGYLPQGQSLTAEETLDEYLRGGIPGLDAARDEVERLAAQMAEGDSQALRAYDETYTRFEALGGYAIEQRIDEIRSGLGLEHVDPKTPLNRLSGGQRTRAGLARLLLADPDLLILDEPTNHLDIEAMEWLERFLTTCRGAAIVVSHDWTFLDATVAHILELDDKTHRLAEYAGNYSAYVQAKARELDKQWQAWQDQQDEVVRLKGAAAHLRGLAKLRRGGKADDGDKFAKAFFANRSLATVRRAKHIEERIDRMLTDDKIDKPKGSWRLKLEFGEMPRGGQIAVALQDLGHRYGDNWLFRHADLTISHGERIALVGGNGTGKTTLLRIIAGELSPSEGAVQIGSNVRVGYMPQEQETLDGDATPLQMIRQLAPMDETAARHLLHFFLFEADEVFVPIGRLSYGERARLLLAKLIVAGANCLLLDEPINHLDIAAREAFEAALDAFPGTILVAAHDRAFIDRFASGIWSPRSGTLRRYVDRAEMARTPA